MLIVQKFGGSSVADTEGIRRVARIIADTRARGDTPVAVLSAAGDTSDILIEKAHAISDSPPGRELDALLSTGELHSVSLMAMQLNELGFDSVSLSGRQAGIRTDRQHGKAKITGVDGTRIRREIQNGRIVIVAGFQGIAENDDVTTLGRGGSDTTATALAAALGAERCEIYTDVDGIYTADPRLVPDAKKLDAIDYEDMLLLARHGSQVLQERSVETAQTGNAELVLLSSFEKKPGTVVKKLDADARPGLCGVTRDREKNSVSIVGKDADAKVLTAAVYLLREEGIPVLSAELKKGICSVTVPPEKLIEALKALHRPVLRHLSP